MSGFFWRFIEREGVACLETAQLSRFRKIGSVHFPPGGPQNAPYWACLFSCWTYYKRFRVSFPETPSVWLHCGTRGIETNGGVWSLGWKLKILGRLRLFRLVVIDVGRLQPA